MLIKNDLLTEYGESVIMELTEEQENQVWDVLVQVRENTLYIEDAIKQIKKIE